MAGQESPQSGSVFDFIYVDQSRIGLYAAQFSDFGNLTSLVSSDAHTDLTKVGAGIGVAKGEVDASQTSTVQRNYDARWIAPLNFLDELHARDMIERDLSKASLGTLVLLSGKLSMIDMRAFERAFGTMAEHEAKKPPLGQRRKQREQHGDTADAASGLRLLASLEQPIFMTFDTTHGRLWSTARPDAVVGSSTDLHLKHGVSVQGEWHLLGVLDCLPGAPSYPENTTVCGDGVNEFSEGILTMMREMHLVMGRPADCYGVTPLIIMREVG